MARALEIRNEITAGNYPNCRTLAHKLCVGVRTIRRDLDFLRDGMKLDIRFDGGRKGYYAASKAGAVKLTEAEMFCMLITMPALHRFEGTPWRAPLEVAFRKLSVQLDDTERKALGLFNGAVSIQRFGCEESDANVMEVVSKGLCGGRALRFWYRKPTQKQAERRHVHPYMILEFDGRWYLRGYDCARRALRTFRLGRMSMPEVTEEKFARPDEMETEAAIRASVGIMEGSCDYEVIIEMDAWLTDIFRGQKLNDTQVWREFPGIGSRLRLRVSCLEEITRWVLSWGEHATVIAPEVLRGAVADAAAKVVTKYAGVAMTQAERN